MAAAPAPAPSPAGGARPPQPSQEAQLCAAAEAGNVDEVTRLLDLGVSPNCKSERRQPPLALAAASDNALEALRVLLARGADPNGETGDPRMHPLSIACWRACTRSVRALLRAGADPFNVDAYGRSALHWAALSCGADVLRALLRLTDARTVDAADASGYTPLMLAVEHGRLEAVELLLQRGADPMASSRLALTPIALADWYGYKKITDALDHAAVERYGRTVASRMANLTLAAGGGAGGASSSASGQGLTGVNPVTVASLAQLPR